MTPRDLVLPFVICLVGCGQASAPTGTTSAVDLIRSEAPADVEELGARPSSTDALLEDVHGEAAIVTDTDPGSHDADAADYALWPDCAPLSGQPCASEKDCPQKSCLRRHCLFGVCRYFKDCCDPKLDTCDDGIKETFDSCEPNGVGPPGFRCINVCASAQCFALESECGGSRSRLPPCVEYRCVKDFGCGVCLGNHQIGSQ